MNETQKYQQITSFLMEQINEVINELKLILKTSEEAFK